MSVFHSDGSSEFISELTSSSDENKENIPPNGFQSKKKAMMRRKLFSNSVSNNNKQNIPPQGLSNSSISDDNKENIPPQGLKPKKKEMLRPILSSSSISNDGKENIPLRVLQPINPEMLHPELPPLVQPEDLEREISKINWIKRFFGWILRRSSVDQITDVTCFGCRIVKRVLWVELPKACKLVLPHFGILGLFVGPCLDEATCEVVDGLTCAAVYLNTWRKRRFGPQRDILGIQCAVMPSPMRSLNSAALQFVSDTQSEADIIQ